MFICFVLSLLLMGSSGFALEATSTQQTLHSTQQNAASSGDAIRMTQERNVFDRTSFKFSRHQSDDNSIIEEADRIFDSIGLTSVDLNYKITPDMTYFSFFSNNFSFFRSRSTQWDNGIYDYRLPTSNYLHLKTFRFVVDAADQKLKYVIAQSTFL